jgi:hypothetical protein
MITRQTRKQLAQSIEIISDRENTVARLASGFVYLLGNPDFYSHLASWRVVIRTPDYIRLLGRDKLEASFCF